MYYTYLRNCDGLVPQFATQDIWSETPMAECFALGSDVSLFALVNVDELRDVEAGYDDGYEKGQNDGYKDGLGRAATLGAIHNRLREGLDKARAEHEGYACDCPTCADLEDTISRAVSELRALLAPTKG